MAASNVVDLTQIRKGMQIHAADSVKLGKIAEVWVGTDPVDRTTRCDEETCSRLEVHRWGGPLYVPYSAIAGVSGKSVTLNVDATTTLRLDRPAVQRSRARHLPPRSRG